MILPHLRKKVEEINLPGAADFLTFYERELAIRKLQVPSGADFFGIFCGKKGFVHFLTFTMGFDPVVLAELFHFLRSSKISISAA